MTIFQSEITKRIDEEKYNEKLEMILYRISINVHIVIHTVIISYRRYCF